MNQDELHHIAVAQLEGDLCENRLPVLVYKYRTIAQVERFLGDPRLYFAKPQEFNDPFEGKFYLEDSSSPEAAGNRINRANEILNNTGIFCIGKDATNLIMWSHYCDQHKGAAIEFNMSHDKDFFAGAMEVNYHVGYPCFHNMNSPLISAIQHKFEEWRHEKEVRVIKLQTGLIQIKPEAVTSIIFGAKTLQDDIDKIIQKARISGFGHLKFQKCILDDYDYKLKIKEL